MNWKQYHDDLMREVDDRITVALHAYRPNLAQATGILSPTRYPTPTGNAPGGYPPSAHTHPWSDITSTPTTLAGYGITDAQPLDSDLTAIAALSTTSYGRGFLTQADAAAARAYIGAGTGSGSVTSVNITAPAAGLTASGGPITTSGAITLALANDLAALEALSSTGLAARTAADTWAQRTIAGTANRITVTNGDGVSGNPTIDISSSYVGQASITTLGTIGTGVWQGSVIGPAYGGTGVNNGTNALTVPATGTAALLGAANAFTQKNTFDGFTDKNSAEFGSFGIQSYAVNNCWLSDNLYFDGTDLRYRSTGYGIMLDFFSGNFQVRGFVSGTAGVTTGSTQPSNPYGDTPPRLAVNATGSVYVGKASGLGGAGDLDVAGIIAGDKHIRLAEITAPAAPGANQGVIYLEDNGAGKTRLMIKFNTGASQQIASQP